MPIVGAAIASIPDAKDFLRTTRAPGIVGLGGAPSTSRDEPRSALCFGIVLGDTADAICLCQGNETATAQRTRFSPAGLPADQGCDPAFMITVLNSASELHKLIS